MTKIEALQAKRAQLAGSMQAIASAAEAENRNMTAEEQSQFDSHDVEFQNAEGEISRLERLEQVQNRISTPVARLVQPMDAASSTPVPGPVHTTVTGGAPAAHSFANHGFKKGVGEFMLSVFNQKVMGRQDPRLMVNAITTWGGESVGGDGGYLLPPQFAQEILSVVQGGDSFVSSLRPFITNTNLITVPVDETTPWSTSGITGAKTAEAGTISATKPALKQVNVQLYKAAALVHVSDENLRDVPFLASYVMNKMAEKIRYICEDWCMNGAGAGAEPLGLTKGAGTVTIAKESTQTRATSPLVPQNLANMFAALLPGGASRAFWVMNPTVLPYLWTLTLGNAGFPLYVADFKAAPGGILLGRPVILSETAAIAGSLNDVVLVDPAGYICAMQSEGISAATTIAFAFDQGLQSFRATLRCGGAPILQAKIARAKSSSTYAGHVINLAAS